MYVFSSKRGSFEKITIKLKKEGVNFNLRKQVGKARERAKQKKDESPIAFSKKRGIFAPHFSSNAELAQLVRACDS